MNQPITTLLYTNLKQWLSARGLWLVFGAALVPFLLTAAWVGTHQGDVAVDPIQIDAPASIEDGWIVAPAGEEVTLRVTIRNAGQGTVGQFNNTLGVGTVQGRNFTPLRSFGGPQPVQTRVIDGLEPGEEVELTLTWTFRSSDARRPGQLGVLALADSPDAQGQDSVGEKDEFNNQQFRPVRIRHDVPAEDTAPTPSPDLHGNTSSNRSVDLATVDLSRSSAEIVPGETVTFTATFENVGATDVENASVSLRLHQVVGNQTFPAQGARTEETITLASGETDTITLEWTAQAGSYWAQAWIHPGEAANDTEVSNNADEQAFAVENPPEESYESPSPPERLTLKQFYSDLLNLLQLRILVPFIALFYAGGVISDEKQRGSLVYILTRPVERWLFPLTKLASGYLVAVGPIVLGLFASFVLLFGSADVDVAFLSTSLAVTLIALFVYGGFFVLLGTLVDRPYLIGVGFVVGWEGIVGNFVPWVQQLTIIHHLQQVIDKIDVEQGFVIAGEPTAKVLVAGVAFLAAAAIVMKRREFDV